LIELTGAKVVFEAAIRDEIARERRQGEEGRNTGRAPSKSMIHDEVPPLEMRRARRIRDVANHPHPKASHNP
jgi:hypothetical protein